MLLLMIQEGRATIVANKSSVRSAVKSTKPVLLYRNNQQDESRRKLARSARQLGLCMKTTVLDVVGRLECKSACWQVVEWSIDGSMLYWLKICEGGCLYA